MGFLVECWGFVFFQIFADFLNDITRVNVERTIGHVALAGRYVFPSRIQSAQGGKEALLEIGRDCWTCRVS